MLEKTILVIGTYDTKEDELIYLAGCIDAQGGTVLKMDVSVLGEPSEPCDVSKHDIARAAQSTIQEAIKCGDENHAMQKLS